jgi:hypothetical protein
MLQLFGDPLRFTQNGRPFGFRILRKETFMAAHPLLIEIGTEDLPARYVETLTTALRTRCRPSNAAPYSGSYATINSRKMKAQCDAD